MSDSFSSDFSSDFGNGYTPGTLSETQAQQAISAAVVSVVSGSLVSGFARSTPATYFDSTGTLQIAAANQLRYTHDPVTLASLGILLEAASTNGVRNPRAEQCVTGIVGTAPAALPLYWSTTLPGGINCAIQQVTSIYGIPAVRLRFYGTATASGPIRLLLENGGGLTGLPVNTTVAKGAWLRLFAGTFSNIVTFTHYGDLQDSTGAKGVGTSLQTDFKSSITSTFTRFSNTEATPASGNAPFAAYVFGFQATTSGVGSVIDFTIDVGGPQMEVGSVLTSLILPPVGLPTVTARSADQITAISQSLSGAFLSTAIATLTPTQANDTIGASGAIRIQGSISIGQQSQSISAAASAHVSSPSTSPFSAEFSSDFGEGPGTSLQQDQQQLTALGGPVANASLSVSEAAHTISAAGGATTRVLVALTQSDDAIIANGLLIVGGSLTKTAGNQIVTSSCVVSLPGGLAESQTMNTVTAQASVVAIGAISEAQTSQTGASSGIVTVYGPLARQNQPPNTLEANAGPVAKVTISSTQSDNVETMLGLVSSGASLTSSEPANTAFANASAIAGAGLAKTTTDQTVAASAKAVLSGSSAADQADDGVVAAAIIPIASHVSSTSQGDAILALAASGISSSAIVVQSSETIASSTDTSAHGDVVGRQEDDAGSAIGVVAIGASLSKIQVQAPTDIRMGTSLGISRLRVCQIAPDIRRYLVPPH